MLKIILYNLKFATQCSRIVQLYVSYHIETIFKIKYLSFKKVRNNTYL